MRACGLILALAALGLVSAKELSVKDVKVSIQEADGQQVLTNSGSYPASLLSHPKLAAQQSMQVTATILADGEAFKPQQMFLAFKHSDTKVSAYIVGKAKKQGAHEVMASPWLIERQIGKLAGAYEVTLMVGDPQASQGLLWNLGSVELVLPATDAAPSVRTAHNQPISNARPIVTHMFRPPEKRPPAAISYFFAGLIVLTFVALLGFLVFGLGANLKGWPQGITGLYALAFHGLIAAMLGLYLLFWVSWNLVQTLPVALGLGAALVLVGHKALSGLADIRLKSKGAGGSKLTQHKTE